MSYLVRYNDHFFNKIGINLMYKKGSLGCLLRFTKFIQIAHQVHNKTT